MSNGNLATLGAEAHKKCRPPGEACQWCLGKYWLQPGDWDVINFYGRVQDQVVNLTPGGVREGAAVFAPRLEGWLAACKLYAVSKEDRVELLDDTRALFEAMHDRGRVWGLHTMDPKELLPPEIC